MQGLRRPTQGVQGRAAIAVGRGVQRLQGDGAVAAAQGLLMPAEAVQGGRQIAKGRGIVGLDFEGAFDEFSAARQVARLDAPHAEQMQRLEMRGVGVQHRLIDAPRLVQPPGLVQGPPLVTQGVELRPPQYIRYHTHGHLWTNAPPGSPRIGARDRPRSGTVRCQRNQRVRCAGRSRSKAPAVTERRPRT